MGLFSFLFRDSARKLIKQMVTATDVIQIAVYYKLVQIYEKKYGHDRGVAIAAAVTNKLFAKVSPKHSQQDLQLAEQLATDILKNDPEVRYAALMACRAILLHEVDRKSEAQQFVWDTIQWMASIWDLPPDEANMDRINNLARTLHAKYSMSDVR